MDWGLLGIGLIPFCAWAAGTGWALRNGLFFTAAAFTLAAFNGLVFSMLAAGATVPDWLITSATLLRVPVVVSLIVAVVYAWNGVRFTDVPGWLRDRFGVRQ